MPSPIIKCLACAGGIGGVCGGGILIAKHINFDSKSVPKSVKEKLISEGYKLLDLTNSNSEGWSRIIEAYKNEDKDEKRFADVEKTGDPAIAGIQANCRELIAQENVSDEEYLKARRWCVIPVMVRSKFAEGTLLNYESTDSSNNNSWNKLANKHWGEGIDEKLKISSESKNNEEEKRTEIKLRCKEKAESDSTNEDFYETINKVNMWCTKASADSINN